MENQLIKFETALKYKEKGFDLTTGGRYSLASEGTTDSKTIVTVYMAPQALVQRWLRERYFLHIEISIVNSSRMSYLLALIKKEYDSGMFISGGGDFESYEEALEEALTKALDLI